MPLDPFQGFQDEGRTQPEERVGDVQQRESGFQQEVTVDPLGSTMKAAGAASPDTAARVLKLRLKTGLPPAVIEKNLDEVERQATASDFNPDRFRKDNPKLAQWLTDEPTRAAAVRDDLPTLGLLEKSLRTGGDIGVSLLKGFGHAPEALVGIADILTLGRTGQALERFVGYNPKADQELLSHYYSDPQRQAFLRVQEARGWIGKAAAALSNPSVIGHSVLESLPLMLGGAAVARGTLALLPAVGATAAGAIGEGVVAAGSAAEQTRQSGETGTLTPSQAALSVASGAGTGALSLFGGKLAERLGIGDIDTMLAGATVTNEAKRGLVKEVVYGAVAEGFLEELPQSIQEQVLQNAAQGRPLDEGVVDNAVLGALAGAVMGGGANFIHHVAPSQMVLEDINKAVQESKTGQRDMALLGEFAQQITDDGLTHIYVPAADLVEFYQKKGVDPALVATQLTGDENALALALETNGDVAIPTASYIQQVAGTDDAPFFEQAARVKPNQPNGLEVKADLEQKAKEAEQQAAADEAAAQAVKDEANVATADTIKQALVGELVDRGLTDPTTADVVSTIVAGAFPNLAARAGADLTTLVQQWLPEVQTGAQTARPAGEVPPGQAAADQMAGGVATETAVPVEGQPETPTSRRDAAVETLRAAGVEPSTELMQLDRGQVDALNEEVDALTQSIRDQAPPGSRLEAFVTNQGELFVDSVVVQQSQQNQGAGTRMMQQLLAWADKNNLQVSLDAAPNQGKKAALQRFYRRLGFKSSSSARDYRPDATGSLVRAKQSERQQAQESPTFYQAPASAKDTETSVNLDKAPIQIKDNGDAIMSTRVPSGPNAAPQTDVLVTNLDVLRADKAAGGNVTERQAAVLREDIDRETKLGTEKTVSPTGKVTKKKIVAVDNVPAFPQLTKNERARLSDDAIIERLVEIMTGNLRWLWNQAEPWRERAKQWYVGANRIAGEMATQYGITRNQAAAVLASLSPQMDWFKNVNLAERVLKLYHDAEQTNPTLTPALFAAYEARTRKSAKGSTRGNLADILKTIEENRALYEGKRWLEMDTYGQAILLRETDETNADRSYRIITPEGRHGAVKRNKPDKVQKRRGKPGDPSKVGWGTYQFIANAISVLHNGDPQTIHVALGTQHKVRSFYNNIIDPHYKGAVTIDTHAVAAGLLQPLAGTHYQVEATMSGPASAPFGISGINPIIAEAYFRLAEELGVEPREVQSVTWEAVRGLFKPDQKRGKAGYALTKAVDKLWAQRTSGRITADEFNSRLVEASGGIGSPDWVSPASEPAADQAQLPDGDARGSAAGVPAGRGSDGGRPAGPRGGPAPQRAGILRGRWNRRDNDTPREFFQADPGAEPFYSRLTRAVEESKTTRASGAQWKATIKNAKAGISRDEFALTRVDDLEDGTTYTREEVLQYLSANQVRVVATTFQDQPQSVIDQRIAERADAIYEQLVANEVERLEDNDSGPVLHDPEITATFNEEQGQWEAFLDGDDVGFLYDSEQEALDDAQAEVDKQNERISEHWLQDVRNSVERRTAERLAQDEADRLDSAGGNFNEDATRFAQYTEAGGSPETGGNASYREVLLSVPRMPGTYAEVSQRMFGKAPDDLSDDQQTRLSEHIAGWQDGHGEYDAVENPVVRLRYNVRQSADGRQVLFLEELQPPVREEFDKMPPLFQKNWRDIGLKWALRTAAEMGLDGVSWTTGQMQADRYRLSRQVEAIGWTPAADGTRNVQIVIRHDDLEQHETIDVEVDAGGSVLAAESSHPRLHVQADAMVGQALDRVIGKPMADKVMAATTRGSAKGEGLDIGAKGLKQLYDVDLKNAAKSLPAVKKSGGAVETLDVQFGERPPSSPEHLRPEAIQAIARETGGRGPRYDDIIAERLEWYRTVAKEPILKPVPFVPITDQMRESVMAGQPLFQQARGKISFPEGRAPVVTLFAAKNRSTFLHEAGHLFLRMMGSLVDQLAAQDPATLTAQQQQLVSDYRDVVLPYLGVTSTDQIDTKEQELWARSLEAYFMEGQAPSEQLRAVFSRVASWLTRIYKTLQGLERESGFSINLTPEIREVMDRLLASDEAIAQAEQDADVTALFTTAADAGVPESEFAGYQQLVERASDARRDQLRKRVMSDLQREERAWWQAERATVEQEVTAEVQAQPVYIARAAIRTGTNPDGTPFAEGHAPTPLKLSKQEIVARHGADALTKLRGYYAATGGLPLDLVASMTGFDTGDAMVTALLTAPRMATTIQEQTDLRMRERHGDIMLNPEQMQAEADIAIAEEHRDSVIRAEMAMLRKLKAATAPVKREAREKTQAGVRRLRTELPDARTLKAGAAAQIGVMRLGDVQPERFYAAARRASRTATQAAAAQDFDTAVTAKQDELLNLALYREATRVRNEVDETRRDWDKLFGSNETLAKRRNMDYVAAARAIAATYFWPERRLENAREALTAVKHYNPELYTVLQAQVDAALTTGTDLRTLSSDAFFVMRTAVNSLWTQSLREQQVLVEGKLIDQADAVTALVDRVEALGPATSPTRSKVMTGLLGFRASLTRVEHWVSYLDGNNPEGAFRKYLFTPIADAVGVYREQKATTIKAFVDLLEPIRATLTSDPIAAPEIGYTFDSKAALLHAIAHTGNESNFTKLLRGRNWQASITPVRGVSVDATRWQAFMKRMYDKGIVTKADMDVVQGIWDLNESLKPAAQAAHRELYGHYFNEVTAWPVVTPFGTYRGGYVPAVLDPFDSADGTARVNLDAIEGVHPTMFPPPGFAQNRVEAYAQPLALDLTLMPNHLDKVLRFIHLMPRAKDVSRLVGDRRFRDRMQGYDPVVVGDLLQPWLQRVVSQKVTESGTTKGGQFADRVFRSLRSNSGLGMMAGNVLNTVEQFTGVFTATAKVHPRYLLTALWRSVREPTVVSRQIDEASTFMRQHGSGQVAEMLTTIDDILLNPSKYEQVADFTKRHGYFLQQATQSIVDRVVWMGAYEQAFAHEPGITQEQAVRRADSAVRETQGSGAAEDIASFEVGRPFQRLFTMFFGWANMMANINGYQFAAAARDMGLRKGAGRALYLYTFGFMPLAVLSAAFRAAMSGDWGDDDDDSHLDEVAALFFGSQARLLGAMLPGGQIAMTTVNFFNDVAYDDKISTSPAVAALESAAHSPKSVYDAITADGPKRRAVRDVLTALGLLTGLPAGALSRPLGYLADVADEQAEPEDVTDVVRGLVTGRQPTAP